MFPQIFVIPARRRPESIRKEMKMDSQLKTLGMTERAE